MDAEAMREALLSKRAETIERLRGLDDSFADIVESTLDSNLDDEHDPEGSTIAVSRAQVSSFAADGRRQLVEIDEALARIESGRYGQCDQCGRQIEVGRLEARPATTECIACARAAPRKQAR